MSYRVISTFFDSKSGQYITPEMDCPAHLSNESVKRLFAAGCIQKIPTPLSVDASQPQTIEQPRRGRPAKK